MSQVMKFLAAYLIEQTRLAEVESQLTESARIAAARRALIANALITVDARQASPQLTEEVRVQLAQLAKGAQSAQAYLTEPQVAEKTLMTDVHTFTILRHLLAEDARATEEARMADARATEDARMADARVLR